MPRILPNNARIRFLALAWAVILLPISVFGQAGGQAAQTAAGKAQTAAPNGFSAEGGSYVAIADAIGKDAADAQEKARSAALSILFKGLGKDRLFAEVFVGSPPVGLSFALISSTAESGHVRARVSIGVDDESIRIIERGPYLAAAMALLDKAEKAAAEADERSKAGAEAEAQARLGEALVAYGMTEDSTRSGLALIENLSDSSIFSSAGKRTAPELRRALQTVRDSAASGVGRVQAAQAALEADETGKAVGESVKRAMTAADHADTLLSESNALIADPASASLDRLEPLRDKLALERRAIADAKADLSRAKDALPKDNSYRSDELEYAKRRLSTMDASLASAHRSVDREIRDPAVRRAARARAFRWAFLHSPSEYLSVRAYLPFAVEPENDEALSIVPFNFVAAAEGAFPLGSGGIWARSRVSSQTVDLSSARSGDEEYSLRQSFDIGIWKRVLFFAGFGWDWYRGYDSSKFIKPGQLEIGLGGVSGHGKNDKDRRADWLIALSYDLPYATEDFMLWNYLNLGLEAQFRLGDVALLEASAFERLHKTPKDLTGYDYAATLNWAVGCGVKLPPPFTIGGEFYGSLVNPVTSDGLGDREPGPGGAFRFYLSYSL